MGMVVDRQGVLPAESNLAAIAGPIPRTTVEDMRAF